MSRCGKCQFYTADTAVGVPDSLAMGTCRRYPPVLVGFIDAPGTLAEIKNDGYWRQPPMAANEWCGEFKGFTKEGDG